jgi:hypothetical protein
MIKLKDLLFEQEEKKIHPKVSHWKNEMAQKYASILLEKYGDDGEKYDTIFGDSMIMWKDVELIDEEKYKYKVRKIDKLYVLDEHIEHSFPADHIDYVYSTLKIPQIQAKDGKSTIDPDLVGKFAGVTGSIIVDGLKGEVTARCGDTVANDVTLNFVLDAINGKVEATKEEYGKRILALKESLGENLRKWFQKGGAGGTTAGGWDRYSSTGKKLGKCGGGKKGEAYAACLSASKAAKLGKKGIASFVRRKRAAQKKGGDPRKGGERKKAQKTIKVKTGA